MYKNLQGLYTHSIGLGRGTRKWLGKVFESTALENITLLVMYKMVKEDGVVIVVVGVGGNLNYHT